MNSDTNQNLEDNQDEENQNIDDFWDFDNITDILNGRANPDDSAVPVSTPKPAYNRPQNKPPEPQRPNPGLAPTRPSTQRSPQKANRPQTPAAAKSIKEANMADEVQSGQTRKFDAGRRKAENPSKNSPDETYHYTGRDIRSSRQRLNKPPEVAELKVSENKEKIKNRRRENEENAEAKKSGSIVSGILKVVLYIVGIAVISGVIAYNIIMVANDVFAFMKEPTEAEVVIPEDADIPEIARILHEKELIKYPGIFNLYLSYRKKDKIWEYEPGVYTVSADTNYDDMIAMFRKKAAARETVRITIPEGYSIEEIIGEFVDNNKMGTREGFTKVINEYDFSESYRFLKPLYETELSPDRKYRLEGYLFPDTYDFYRDESELNIIIRFLDNFSYQFTEHFYNTVEILDKTYKESTGHGMTIDDIITLASIIQWEAALNDDFQKISAVFHNRLTSPGSYPRLESDATVQYTHLEQYYDTEKEKYRYKRSTGDDLRNLLELDEPYNTYKRNGLPPSAICNPGYEAIFAAIWPEENSPYYFFVANTTTGEVYYGRTLAEHTENINRARAGD